MIEREEFEGGVRIVARPLSGDPADLHFLMQIQAEIIEPSGKGKPQVRISFHGVPIGKPLLPVDARTWRIAFDAIMAEADKIAEEMKAAKSKSAPKRKRKK
ncbi:MAG: hypothetical protein DWQ35_23135 [Planctomycetota bacterium]|nr:MAG: hypothetical protein DWQ35_23135 [Planctomycetota bacterium]REK23301.1 MAG: hypothetical protein DWQ42_15575 [Planctomycetota bacterium]REK39215.1 MAG: hypothetical protein DWQ46_18185 [Planctomycetota bacterium]